MNEDRRVAPSRRTIVRTAAWTAPAVAMMSAAPAWAVSGETLTGGEVGSDIERKPNPDVVVWKITILVDQALAAGALSVVFSGVSAVTGLLVKTKPQPKDPGTTWTGDDLTRRVYPLAVAAGEQVTLEATFTRSDNAANETATATFSCLGMTGQIIVTDSY